MSTAHPLETITPMLFLPSSPRVVVDGRYEVVLPIATGGMAEVLEVRHLTTRRTFALKLLRTELRSRADLAERLRREAEALGRIDHQGVVSVVDSGVCEKHGRYLVLEKLEGRGLDGLLAARGSLGEDGALTVLRGVLSALADVHAKGLVHRDVKPANVFVATSRGGDETIKLIDFGVVGVATTGNVSRLTAAGDLLGTLAYMAPEQLLDPTRVDPRSDLYGAALVALECLGVPLETFNQVRREGRPATAALGWTSIDERVVGVLDQMLMLDPGQRPASAAAVLQALRDVPASARRLLGYEKNAVAPRDTPTSCEPAVHRQAMQEVETRRQQRRAPYVTPVRLVLTSGNADGRSEDISSGGMLVTVRGDADVSPRVIVRFALPTTGRVVSIPATTRWTRRQPGRTALGLSFDGIEPSAVEAIDAYVRYVSAET